MTGQRLRVMAQLFRIGDRFSAQVVQVNIVQLDLVDVAMQQITHAFMTADFTVYLSWQVGQCNPARKALAEVRKQLKDRGY